MRLASGTVALLGFGGSFVSGVAIPEVKARGVDCNKPTTGYDSSCWATLGLTDYVNQWWTKNGAGCSSSRGFARCFLDSIQQTSMDCSVLQNDGCTAPTPQAIKDPRDFYVAYAIYAINQAYNTYWSGLTTAQSDAALVVPAIIQLLDPPTTSNVLLNDLLTALSAGLAFLGPEDAVVGALVTGASQAVEVGKFLFPVGTADSQNAQLAKVDQSLSQTVEALQSNINQALPATLNDHTAFLAFASSGQFSQLPSTSIFDDTKTFLTPIYTYIISQCLQANNIVLARGPPGTDIQQIVASDQEDLSHVNCPSYDSLGICDAWYYDSNTNQSYSFLSYSDWTHDYHSEMESIFTQWTTPKLLMTNAEACAAGGGAQKQGDVISASPQGVNSNCLSDLKVCTWNQNDQGASSADKLFSDCDNPNGWIGAGCPGIDGGIAVPPGYIGPNWYGEAGWCTG